MPRRLHRPEPVSSQGARPIDGVTPGWRGAGRILDGETLIVTDRYSTGAEILAQLHHLMQPPAEDAPFASRQRFQRAFRDNAMRLLAPVVDHRLALVDARLIGFLADLYPRLPRFTLPFAHVQELHGAWLRYDEGVHLAVLGHRVHPFYGTYAPARTSHLELFATWISQYQGSRARAIDVGCGCGVLAMMLCKAGFERVLATDDNPNAIESVTRELKRQARPIDVQVADLLGENDGPVDLVVFNPPWVRGETGGLVDRALVYSEGLFERFFDQATERLTPEGRVAMVFSNIGSLVQPELPHPIETELTRGRLRLVQKLQRKVKPARTRSGRKRKTKEKVEVWELAPV